MCSLAPCCTFNDPSVKQQGRMSNMLKHLTVHLRWVGWGQFRGLKLLRNWHPPPPTHHIGRPNARLAPTRNFAHRPPSSWLGAIKLAFWKSLRAPKQVLNWIEFGFMGVFQSECPTVPQVYTFHLIILVLLAICDTAPVGPST